MGSHDGGITALGCGRFDGPLGLGQGGVALLQLFDPPFHLPRGLEFRGEQHLEPLAGPGDKLPTGREHEAEQVQEVAKEVEVEGAHVFREGQSH